MLEGLFNQDNDQIEKYYSKLKNIVIKSPDGFEMIPELYYVPRENITAEYKDPKSQIRKPSKRLPHLWSQSLYIIARLLHDVSPFKPRKSLHPPMLIRLTDVSTKPQNPN